MCMRVFIRLSLAAMAVLASVGIALPASHAAQLSAARTGISKKAASPALKLSMNPARIAMNRDTRVRILVTNVAGQPVPRALITVTGISQPLVRTAPRGSLALVLRATAAGTITVVASVTGYSAARLRVPVVPGSPATIVAVKRGMTVQAPRAKPVVGKVGNDLFEQYRGSTAGNQFASLGLRDGTLMDLNANTDVVIVDPFHATLSKGEVFLEVVHGSVSHQIQVGTAVAATKGTRLDVRVDPKTKAAVVTVVEGQVLVSNTRVNGAARSVLVGAGQQSTIAGAAPPSTPKAIDLSKLLAWVKNLPNTTTATVPPVLNLPPVRSTPVALPAAGGTPIITVTGVLSSTTFTAAGGPYLLRQSVTVPAGSTLTVEPGARLLMAQDAYLQVEGTLKAQGTAAAPIVVTSAAAQPKPGDWQYIRIDGSGASGSVLDHVQLFYGSANGGAFGMLSLTQGANVTLSNSVLAQGAHLGAWVDTSDQAHGDQLRLRRQRQLCPGGPGRRPRLDHRYRLWSRASSASTSSAAPSPYATWFPTDVPVVLSQGSTLAAGASLTLAPGAVI